MNERPRDETDKLTMSWYWYENRGILIEGNWKYCLVIRQFQIVIQKSSGSTEGIPSCGREFSKEGIFHFPLLLLLLLLNQVYHSKFSKKFLKKIDDLIQSDLNVVWCLVEIVVMYRNANFGWLLLNNWISFLTWKVNYCA